MGSTGEATDRDILALDCTRSNPDFSDKVGLNLAQVWLLPFAVVRLHVGDLQVVVGWGSMSMGDPSLSHYGGRGGGVKWSLATGSTLLRKIFKLGTLWMITIWFNFAENVTKLFNLVATRTTATRQSWRRSRNVRTSTSDRSRTTSSTSNVTWTI